MDELRTYDSVRGGRRQVFIPPEVPIDVLEAIRASKEGPVLISGATGTGKDLLADFLASEWMHDGRSGIVHVLNCGALEENSIRSEMFGHIKGSFSDAVQDRDGILLSCQGGIIILSDLDQLNSRDQELMLGYIQTGEIRPFGSDVPRKVPNPPRLLATTSTDVEAESDLLSKLLQQFKWKVRLAKFSDQRSKIPTLLKVWLHDRGILVSGRLLIFAFAHDWRGNGLELQMFCDKALEYLAHDGGSVVHCREDLLKLPMDVFVRLNKYAYYLLHLHEKHHGLDVVERAKNDDALRLGLLLLWELVECSSEGRTKLAIPIDMLDSEELKCSLGIDGLPASYYDSSVADFLEAFAVAAYNPLVVYTDESEHDATLVQEGVYGMVPDLFLCEERAEISQEFADALSSLMSPKFSTKPVQLSRTEPELSYRYYAKPEGDARHVPSPSKNDLLTEADGDAVAGARLSPFKDFNILQVGFKWAQLVIGYDANKGVLSAVFGGKTVLGVPIGDLPGLGSLKSQGELTVPGRIFEFVLRAGGMASVDDLISRVGVTEGARVQQVSSLNRSITRWFFPKGVKVATNPIYYEISVQAYRAAFTVMDVSAEDYRALEIRDTMNGHSSHEKLT